MRAELEYNARSIPPVDIARSFIPPGPHFTRLLARNHTLLLGPRGSGKTSLLKMLTGKALNNWSHPQAADLSSQVSFNAAFISADITWGKQLDSLDKLGFDQRKKQAAFVLHTLRALIFSMREAGDLGRGEIKPHIRHLGINLDAGKEEQFVKLVVGNLNVVPKINSLLGLELALQAKLDAINSGDDDGSFSVESFPSKLSLLVAGINGIIGEDNRRWALLFDEMEIAPTWIKSFLLSGIRSFDERIIVKLALAPYMEDAGLERTPTSPQPIHDYQTVQLTYPNKEEAAQFSAELFATTFRRVGINFDSLARLLGPPRGQVVHDRRPDRGRRARVPPDFEELAEKDDSFRRYVDERKIFSNSYAFTENNIAQDIRKVLPIVVARNFYLRRFEKGRVVAERSRKSNSLYTGFPSILEITEGNPRAILTCVGPLAQQYRDLIEDDLSPSWVPTSIQGQAIQRVELLLTSLLQVIPIDIGGFETARGLLAFVDQIGRAFEDRLLKGPFVTDYVGTFVLDDGVPQPVINAIGKALNAGAIVHVPHPGSGPDSLLRGLRGQRFRLSYALASRYRLLLTLGDRVNLSKLLLEMRGVRIENTQRNFFDEDG